MCHSFDHDTILCPYYACYAHPNSSFPLAQCTGLEVGGPFGLIAKFDVGDSYCALEETLDVVHNLLNTPLGGVVMIVCMRSLLAFILIMLSPIPLIIPMFPLRVRNSLFPPSIL